MNRLEISFLFLGFLILMSCNKDAEEDIQNQIECIEGWYPGADGNSGYLLKCPEDLVTDQNCIKSFVILVEVDNYDGSDNAVLTIRSTDDMGHVVDHITELGIHSQVFITVLEFDAKIQYEYEVTIKTPFTCVVNGVKGFFTYYVDVPCFASAELQFRIICA